MDNGALPSQGIESPQEPRRKRAKQDTPLSPRASLQKEIDLISEKLKEEWMGKIIFDVYPCYATASDLGELKKDVDICTYFNGSTAYKKLYLDPTKYGPDNEEGNVFGESYRKLKDDLELAALECGSPIVANGGGPSRKQFQCGICYRRRKSEKKKRKAGDFKKSSLINNDKGNRRKNGKSLPRRSNAAAFDKHKCPFGFVIRCDSLGFFISLAKCGGNNLHMYHPKIDGTEIQYPTRLLPQDEIKNFERLSKSCTNAGVGRNFFFSKYNSYLSKQKISYLFNESRIDGAAHQSDVEELLAWFKKNDQVSYHCLWDVVIPKDLEKIPFSNTQLTENLQEYGKL